MSEEQLKAFLEKVKLIPNCKKSSKQQLPLKLRLQSPKKQGFQLMQKIFNRWGIARKCQTRSWRVQLAALAQIRGDLTVLWLGVLNSPGEFPQITPSKPLALTGLFIASIV